MSINDENREGTRAYAFTTEPQEDVGSDTFSRFHYQAEVTARYCLLMLRKKEDIEGILCEWHEDFVIIRPKNATEIVSVKHREKSQNAWTPRGLIEDGGLAKLFDNWRLLNKTTKCLLLTNSGLNPDMREIAKLIHSRKLDSINIAAEKMAEHFVKAVPGVESEEIIEFLGSLSIDCELPGRHSIRSVNIEQFARPIAREIGMEGVQFQPFYDRLVQEVEEAMRSATGSEGSILRYVSDPKRLSLDVARQRRITNRTIIPAQVTTLFREITSLPPELLTTKGAEKTPSSILEIKLQKGGLGPTAIASAKQLRAAWSSLEAKYRPGLSFGQGEIEDLRIRVNNIAADAEAAAMAITNDGAKYGPAMRIELKKRAIVENIGRESVFPVDDNHLHGSLQVRPMGSQVQYDYWHTPREGPRKTCQG